MKIKELGKAHLIGYLDGLLKGISSRDDVPQEVKQICKEGNDRVEQYFCEHNGEFKNGVCLECGDYV